MKAKLFPFSMASFVRSFVSFANFQKKVTLRKGSRLVIFQHIFFEIGFEIVEISRNIIFPRSMKTSWWNLLSPLPHGGEDALVKNGCRGGWRSRIGGLLHDCSSETILSMRIMRGIRLLYLKYSMWNSLWN